MSRNCSFVSFSIVSVAPFINKTVFLRDLSYFHDLILSFSSLEIINVVISKKHLLNTAAAAAAAVNPNGIKTLLANGCSTFFIKGKQVFSNGPRSPPRNLPDFLYFM